MKIKRLCIGTVAAMLPLMAACSSSHKNLPLPATKTGTAAACGAGGLADGAGCGASTATSSANAQPDAAATAEPVSDQDFLADVTPASDADAVNFFLNTCLSCHDAQTGSVKSFWPLDKDTFNKDSLTTDTQAPEVFWVLLLKAKGIINANPTAMPPKDLASADLATLMSVLKWIEVNIPSAVQEGEQEYGDTVPPGTLGVGVLMNFKCTQPASFREFVTRITNDVFNREPTPDELKLGTGQPDDPVTLQDRVNIATRIFNDDGWHQEFETVGLRKFAAKVSGSDQLMTVPNQISQAQLTDLQDEFYQMLLAGYQTSSYKDLLLGDTIKVTANTAPLYGCTAPTSGTWGDCQLQAPRSSYFTTFSYLGSKPSSFLRTNNNYGRAATMYFVIRGDVFQPGFGQDGGGEVVNPLPDCLKTKDFRGQQEAAIAYNGSGAVPLSANLCQSCHISREMAAGSILYRPFNPAGMIYGSQVQIDATDPDFASATAANMISKDHLTGPTVQVDVNFLQSLLATDGTEQACVAAADTSNNKDVPLTTVKDLATFLIGDGSALAGGLARHLPRAMSNLETTSEEIIVKINQAFTDGGGRLEPMMKAYFESETYSCAQ